jgi:hypothetical protein
MESVFSVKHVVNMHRLSLVAVGYLISDTQTGAMIAMTN